jgi:predicted N-formylglutamate amidohydrolase
MAAGKTGQAPALLGLDEPPPVEMVNPEGASHAVLVCDHASNKVPKRLQSLGLEPALLQEHIAWDPGAAVVARDVAAQLDAPLVLSGYSRLVIDCNRPLGHVDSIAARSAGIAIPANLGLSRAERSIRIDALFRPYHGTISELLDSRSNRPNWLISIHSFAPILNGRLRPWQIGISHWRDQRLAHLLLDALRHDGNFAIGDNAPYPIDRSIDYTIPVHGEGRDMPSVMIELRQDEIGTPAGATAWARRIVTAYRRIEAYLLRLASTPK